MLLSSNHIRVIDKQGEQYFGNSFVLMQNAGRAIFDVVSLYYKKRQVIVLCGPGNNGGDGFLAASIFKKNGWEVNVLLYGEVGSYNARRAKSLWHDNVDVLVVDNLKKIIKNNAIIVDAVFGIGLSKLVPSQVLFCFDYIQSIRVEYNINVVAVDIATGINSDTGFIMGGSLIADATVTFFCKKLGQALYPGKQYSGKIIVNKLSFDFTMPKCSFYENNINLWTIPSLGSDFNKYKRGHAIISGACIDYSGATKMSAMAALRAGSGIVTVFADADVLPIYINFFQSVIVRDIDSFESFLINKYVCAILVGPGCKSDAITRKRTLMALRSKKNCIIDAGAITSFCENTKDLFDAIDGNVIMTPHEGEFVRVFEFDKTNKIVSVQQAAKLSGAVIVLKGADTLIAAPDGRVVINNNASFYLATAGSGDVLSGIVTGLVAQRMDIFDAACAAVWIHSECANKLGRCLIAEDLIRVMPKVFSLFDV